MEISLRKNKQVATAIAIAGRSCRPCDVCGRDQARWFCAADEAYLCAKCDGSVHGANAVASKHERVPLGPAGLPTLKLPSVMAYAYYDKSKECKEPGPSSLAFGSRKKPRSIRHHSHTTSNTTSAANFSAEYCLRATSSVVDVKTEPASPEMDVGSQDLDHHEFSAHEVPIFLPTEQELFLPFHSDPSHSFINLNAISSDRIAKEEASCTDLKYGICKELLGSRMEERSREELQEIEMMAGDDDDLSIVGEMGLFGMCDGDLIINADYDRYGLHFSSIEALEDCRDPSQGDEVAEDQLIEGVDAESGGVMIEGPLISWSRVKTEEVMEDYDEEENLKLEVDELLACALITGFKAEELADDDDEDDDDYGKEEEEAVGCKGSALLERKVSLKLDYEDVLSAWSDRGSLWTDGRRPQVVPEDCTTDYDTALSLENIGQQLVPDLNFNYCSNKLSTCNSTNLQLNIYGGGDTSDPQAAALGLVPVANNNLHIVGDDVTCMMGSHVNSYNGREARVMRYREKRRNRLFSKKIRYEVRKLNAEMRPRWKGRFVKRSSVVLT